MIDVEVLTGKPMARRGDKMLRAMIEAAPAAGFRPIVVESWGQRAPILMSYGLGHPQRRPWTQAHLAAGGRLIGWDLGYWHRDVPMHFGMRLTVDADHPHVRVKAMLGHAPAHRWDAAGIPLREDFYEHGPIILCGLGRKQRHITGHAQQQWELERLRELHRRFPGRRILYRPKRQESPLAGCEFAMGAIEDVLRNASLLVCAHSNTAVDACIAGVPVECDDGAAFALYEGKPAPGSDERRAFLEALAWWQWTMQEAPAAWEFIREQLDV